MGTPVTIIVRKNQAYFADAYGRQAENNII